MPKTKSPSKAQNQARNQTQDKTPLQRYLTLPLQKLLQKKMIILMGPRQVGKTTLSQNLNGNFAYYNYDVKKDLRVFLNQDWDYSKELVIFDELHKMKKWKLWLKGIYDEGLAKKQNFLITGSARLDLAKKMGDSLAGRFFSVRIHPLDLKELKKHGDLQKNYQKLLQVSGFPEPFFEGTEQFYNLWSKSHADIILRQDLLTLETIRDLDGIESLLQMLTTRVGSTISYNSLAEDLHKDDKTIKRWLNLLEQLYIVFRLNSYSKNIARGLRKSGKYYFYDCARVIGDESQKLENLTALALKKELELQEDTNGVPGTLHFIQSKEKKEIDFLIQQKNQPAKLLELKLSEANPTANFMAFEKYFPRCEKIQLVKNLDREYVSKNAVQVRSALDFLQNIELNPFA